MKRWHRRMFLLAPVMLVVAGCGTGAAAPVVLPATSEGPTASERGVEGAPLPPLVRFDDPTPTPGGPTPTALPVPSLGPGEVGVILQSGSAARYRVREQLANRNLPNDAVGETSQVTGAIVFRSDGTLDPSRSGFTIRMDTLRSDESRRDDYLRRSAVQTGAYPLAKFVPRQITGLPWPLPENGTIAFQLSGDMTIRATTAPVSWEMTASLSPHGAVGQAKTSFTFGHFGMSVPRVFVVLSVDDNIRLELDFNAQVERPGG